MTMPERLPEATESDVTLCGVHGHWAEEDGTCFECLLDRIGRDLDGCTVYRLYRDPLFEDAPLVPPCVTTFFPMTARA